MDVVLTQFVDVFYVFVQSKLKQLQLTSILLQKENIILKFWRCQQIYFCNSILLIALYRPNHLLVVGVVVLLQKNSNMKNLLVTTD